MGVAPGIMWFFKRRESFPKALQTLLVEQNAAIGALQLKVKGLEDALASLEDKHERLRGKFYARKQADEPLEESKASILARFRRGEIKA